MDERGHRIYFDHFRFVLYVYSEPDLFAHFEFERDLFFDQYGVFIVFVFEKKKEDRFVVRVLVALIRFVLNGI